MDKFELKETFSVKPGELYRAWLDSRIHGEMTGSPAYLETLENSARRGRELQTGLDRFLFRTDEKLFYLNRQAIIHPAGNHPDELREKKKQPV